MQVKLINLMKLQQHIGGPISIMEVFLDQVIRAKEDVANVTKQPTV